MPNQPFDHDDHVRKLEEAEQFLRLHDKDALAGAIGRAKAIHIDMQGRIATARRAAVDVLTLADRCNRLYSTLHEYVIRPHAPWIGCDLFPKHQPGDDDGSDGG